MAKHPNRPGSTKIRLLSILAGHLATGAVTTAKLASLAVTGAKIAAATITPDKLAVGIDDNPGNTFIIRLAIVAGAAANVTYTATYAFRVIDAWAVHTGGAGEASDTLTLKNGSTAITDAMDWSGADTVVVRAGQIDDAADELAIDDVLTAVPSDDDSGDDLGAGILYVLCEPIA